MLQVEHISKRYGTTLALDNVALTIPKGVCYGLVGPNGSGKSTLIKIISRIIREYDGKVEFVGNENGRLGYVPQDISLEEKLTAKTNMEFFGKVHGLNGLKLKQTTKTVRRYRVVRKDKRRCGELFRRNEAPFKYRVCTNARSRLNYSR